MAYNRYRGNSGRVERIEDSVSPPAAPDASPASPPSSDASPLPPPPREEATERPRPPFAPPSPPPGAGVLPGLGEGFIRRLLRALSPGGLETEDFLLMAILYLLYRETGDRDFLIMLGGILFL